MRIIIILISGLTFWSCKSSNDNFDPFDDDFSLHNKIDIANYDSLFDDIDYWALQKRDNGLKTFYVLYRSPYFFINDKIVGKGFSLLIDSIATADCNFRFYQRADTDDVLKELYAQNPIDFELVKVKLFELGVTEIKILSDTVLPIQLEITNLDRKLFNAKLHAECNFEGHIIRYINFTNDNLP